VAGQQEDSDFKEREALVLRQIQTDLDFFQHHKTQKRWLFRIAQYVSIICGTATPILVLARLGEVAITASVAAVGALAVTAMSTFKWRDEWAQYASAHQFLSDEQLAYLSKAHRQYNGDRQRALENLVARRKAISDANLEEWRQSLLRTDQEPEPKSKEGRT